MKKTFALFVFLLACLPLSVQKISVFTPELFGRGTMYYIHAGVTIGYINAWGGWIVVGREAMERGASCTIRQITGERIGGADGPIACFMNFQKDNRFTGWIDFRGHRRKFCGAVSIDALPVKCYGE